MCLRARVYVLLKYSLASLIFLRSLSVRSVLPVALRQEAHDAAPLIDVFRCWVDGLTRAPSIAYHRHEDLARRRGSAAREAAR